MLVYTGKRILLALLVAATVSFISFMILNLSGDPAIALAGADATPEEIKFVREQYGLDRPLLIQYIEWAGRAIQGNFGDSPYFNQPVKDIIGDRIGVTLILGSCAFLFAVCLAIPLGVIAAIRPNTWIDRAALRPAPMARITVADPVTISPPAHTPFLVVLPVAGSAIT